MGRELERPLVQAAGERRDKRTFSFPDPLPFHLIESKLGLARLVDQQNSSLANFRLQLAGAATVWLSTRRRRAVSIEPDQVGKLERTILATENSQGGLVGLEVRRLELAPEQLPQTDVDLDPFRFQPWIADRPRRADLEARQLNSSIQTDIEVVELDRAPLDRSSFAMTWERTSSSARSRRSEPTETGARAEPQVGSSIQASKTGGVSWESLPGLADHATLPGPSWPTPKARDGRTAHRSPHFSRPNHTPRRRIGQEQSFAPTIEQARSRTKETSGEGSISDGQQCRKSALAPETPLLRSSG